MNEQHVLNNPFDRFTAGSDLCDPDGVVRDGRPMHHGTDYPCTGHAHQRGEHIRCTSSAHSPQERTL